MAALIVRGGVPEHEVYAAPRDSVDQYVSRDGEWSEPLGRALRQHQMLAGQSWRTKVRHGQCYTVFAGENGVTSVRQVRVAAPVCSVPLDAFRRVHAETSRRLLERLRYGIQRHAPGIAVDLIVAHIQRDGDGCIYLHFHLTGRGGTDAEWAALEAYWVGGVGRPETGWLWWSAGDRDRLDRHPAALVQYAAAGLAEELDYEWTPEELAELWRQTRGVALVRAVGAYRDWLGGLKAEGMTVRRHPVHGAVEKVPCRPAVRVRRLREALFTSAGFRVLRACRRDFGDGAVRECWHVRGRPDVTAAEIRAVYADPFGSSTEGTPIPESPPPPPSPPSSSPPIIQPACSEPAPILPPASVASGTAAINLQAGAAEPHAARLAPSQPFHARPLDGPGSNQPREAPADTWPTAVQVSVLDRPDLVPRLWAALDRLAALKARSAEPAEK